MVGLLPLCLEGMNCPSEVEKALKLLHINHRRHAAPLSFIPPSQRIRRLIVMATVEYTGRLLYQLLFAVAIGLIVKWGYDARRRRQVGEFQLS